MEEHFHMSLKWYRPDIALHHFSDTGLSLCSINSDQMPGLSPCVQWYLQLGSTPHPLLHYKPTAPQRLTQNTGNKYFKTIYNIILLFACDCLGRECSLYPAPRRAFKPLAGCYVTQQLLFIYIFIHTYTYMYIFTLHLK